MDEQHNDTGTENSFKLKPRYITLSLVVLLAAVTLFQSYQIFSVNHQIQRHNTEMRNQSTEMKKTMMGIKLASSGDSTNNLQQIKNEVMPSGNVDYGEELNFDSVQSSLDELTGYHEEVSLSGGQEQRYIDIATSKDTACEYCCGIGDSGFGTEDGEIACGCSHNIGLSGLTKYLVKNTDYSNAEIKEEISNWKAVFFPKDTIQEELKERGIDPSTMGLAEMQGGC